MVRTVTNTEYEWCCEPTDIHGDIIDPIFCSSKKEALALAEDRFLEDKGAVEWPVCLVKSVGRGLAGEPDTFDLHSRSYFYLSMNKVDYTIGCYHISDAPLRFQ